MRVYLTPPPYNGLETLSTSSVYGHRRKVSTASVIIQASSKTDKDIQLEGSYMGSASRVIETFRVEVI